MKRILLMEPDDEQAGLFTDWLKGESYSVGRISTPGEVQTSLAGERFDILVMDIDDPRIARDSLKLTRTLKTDAGFKNLPIAVLAYRKESKKLIAAVESGADCFILKPFETDSFLARMEEIGKEYELRAKGKKVLDIVQINYLIDLAGQMERADFFAFSAVIFNKLIIGKIDAILGPQVIAQLLRRASESVGADYEFMKQAGFSGGRISLDGAEKASGEAPVKKITVAYRDYVYAFLHLVKTLTSDILMERGTD